MQAVILAGGKGTRLKPFTTTIPKPLIPLGESPIIEILIRQLARDGFRDIVVAVNHLKELVAAFAGSGERWGVKIRYSVEDDFLGTAGPLKLIHGLAENFIVVNGDTLTTDSFKKFYDFHRRNGAAATIGTSRRRMGIDFGVVRKNDAGRLLGFTEKPSYDFEVSVGINAISRGALRHIKRGERLDLPELILRLLKARENVMAYPLHGRWLDIGHIADYEAANEIFEKERGRFLKGCRRPKRSPVKT